ncbi:HAD hydrolase-like protein [Megasphaera cerevisiae]|jgi:phosphoglycolate phosphatase|uniref:HAD hydrolase-like protein n=1 Tax=Megasphaera cerevisiae TaxID=39029 RepID=UPI00094356D7|nr:HAD hydrolase-like protein [Megasphaera cerevisiae]MCI1750659.1 HAD hydrolase-like protein [Megasphaera cerevisiae]OKY54443.1 haloacid dehalogenase [Megasphaera cerevisiae]
MYKYVLFDLDGTLTDSKEGIIKSVAYALHQLGETTEGRLDQHVVVGPPLLTTFREVYGFSDEKAKRAYGYFQERYSTLGKFENRAFDGVVPMLRQFGDKGIRCFVATSKPQVHAEAICQKFGIAPYVEKIAGPAVGGTDSKADIMKRILAHIGTVQTGEAVMVGDRRFDVIGARMTGMPVILVGFGYGNEAERQEFPPDIFVETVEDLKQTILQY